MSLAHKTAVVTGASSGLGKALVELLSKEGVKVFALARSVESVSFQDSVTRIPIDILDLKSISNAFKAIDQHADKIDILVNCAGKGLVKDFENTTSVEVIEVLDINLKGNIYVAQEAYKRMIPKNSGHIINIISTSGIKARPDEAIYCASKWGLRGFTESLRLAAVPHKIRVTGVFPGGMKTNFWNDGESRDISKYMNPEDVAGEVVNILKAPISIAPSEYVMERGF